MQIDHRGPLAVVSHAGHEVFEPGSSRGGEVVAGMPKIVEMQVWRANSRGGWAVDTATPPKQMAVRNVPMVSRDTR